MKTLNLASKWQGEILNTHGLLTSNTSTTKYTMTAQHIPKRISRANVFVGQLWMKRLTILLKDTKIFLIEPKSMEQSSDMRLIGEIKKENTL